MTVNMGKWPFGHRKTEKSGHRLAAEKTLFSRRWYGGYDLGKPGGHLGNVGLFSGEAQMAHGIESFKTKANHPAHFGSLIARFIALVSIARQSLP